MTTRQNPLHQVDTHTSTKAILAAAHDYGAAWCLSPADRPNWTHDDLEAELLLAPAETAHSKSEVIDLPLPDPDLMRRLGQAIRAPLMITAAASTSPAAVGAEGPAIVEVSFDSGSPEPSACPRKNARRGPRLTSRLEADDAERLLTAYGRGRLMGFEWTAFLTVAWDTIGITTDDQVSGAMTSLMTRLREWASRSKHITGVIGIPIAWIWVHERGPLCGKLHTHLLLAVPRKKRAMLGRVVSDHVERYSGMKATQGANRNEPTPPDEVRWPSGLPEAGPPDFKTAAGAFSATIHVTAPRTDKDAKTFAGKRMRYMAKSIDPLTSIRLTNGAKVGLADWIGIEHLADQGDFRGKRCGYSVFSLGGRQWKTWAANNQVSPDLFAYRLRTYGPLDDDSLDSLAQTLRLKT